MTTRTMARPAARRTTVSGLLAIAWRVLSTAAAAGVLWFAWSALELSIRTRSPIATVFAIALLFAAAAIAHFGWRSEAHR